MLLLDDPRLASDLTPRKFYQVDLRDLGRGWKSIDEVLAAFKLHHTPWELTVTRYLTESEGQRFGIDR